MQTKIDRNEIGYYIIKRFNSIKSDLSTEWGRADKLNYLSRLSELHFLSNAFGFEELGQEIRGYMNEKL